MRALWQVRITFDPIETIQMRCEPSKNLTKHSIIDTYFLLHLHVVLLSSVLDEREIKEVSIVGHKNEGFSLSDVIEELLQ
jgi:hypothetical protein